MVKFRNVRVRMKGGKSRIQRAMVLASGKLRFVKNISRSRSKAPRHRSSRVRSVRPMVRRYTRRHRSGKSLARGLLKIVPPVALVAPALVKAKQGASLNTIQSRYTGFDLETGHFDPHWLIEGYGPFVASKLAIIASGKLAGLLRRL